MSREKSWIPPSAFHACQVCPLNFCCTHLYPSECNVEEGTKLSGHNLYPLGAATQEECAAACLREPECHFWTHNPNVGKCWLKKSDLGKWPSTKGSNSGQKSCGITGGIYLFGPNFDGSSILEDDILSGLIIEDGCDCFSETTAGYFMHKYTIYSWCRYIPTAMYICALFGTFVHAAKKNNTPFEQINAQPAQLRRTRSTPGTTCTRRRALMLETWLDVLPSALTIASASSGLTTQGWNFFDFFTICITECPSAG